MLIQSKYPASPTVNNVTWAFNRDRAGRHVCDVTDEKSVAMLLSVVDIYSEAAPLDPIEPIFQPEPITEADQPAAEAPMSIETIGEAEFDRLWPDYQTATTAVQPLAAIPAATDEPALTQEQATALFAERQADRIRIEGAEAVARQQASLEATAAGLGEPLTVDPSSDVSLTGLPLQPIAFVNGEPVTGDPTPNAHPLDHDGDGKPGGFYVPPVPQRSALDPNNEFPMDPGVNASAIGYAVETNGVSTSDAAVRDPLLDQPSAEDPNLTNAQVAARVRSAKKKQTKRSARKR